MPSPRPRLAMVLATGCAVLGALAALSLALGAFPVAPRDVARVLWAALSGGDSGVADPARAVVMDIRGPRVAAALAVGAALGASGAAFQNVFRNPLVSPDILGVSSGCALGAVLGVLAGWSVAAAQALAFAGGIGAAALAIGIASLVRAHDRVLTLVLSGVVVGSLFGAVLALVKATADPYNELPAISFWLLGSFASIDPRELGVAIALIAVGVAPLAAARWRIDVLALPDEEARALGVDVRRLRMTVVAAATLATSAAVALAGVIAWVGLVVPHAARLLAGPAFARVLPLSALLGAGFLLVVDTLCRTLVAGELAPGVVTALVGTPVFVALLAASARREP